ncbi:JAB domain-containing protein [Flavobacteriaceae bacterium]|jgi:DNA repair protein RadC|nr:JAB domain-containing protein [Flavobacteriaceae bacterium]MDB2388852.1 JAB domain-containing protein [Flavobacteriaceae bacterium]MDB2587658.1 JAB domain-containing protein [Flavobacteriaceae bacterium]
MNKISEIQLFYKNENKEHIIVTNSQSAYDVLREDWSPNTIELQEEFKLLLLDRDNKVLGVYSLSKGGIAGTVVDIRLMMVAALKAKANAIILAHNHPSGNLKPSIQDRELTKKILKASKFLDVQLLDHIIMTKKSYFSFADEGML